MTNLREDSQYAVSGDGGGQQETLDKQFWDREKWQTPPKKTRPKYQLPMRCKTKPQGVCQLWQLNKLRFSSPYLDWKYTFINYSNNLLYTIGNRYMHMYVYICTYTYVLYGYMYIYIHKGQTHLDLADSRKFIVLLSASVFQAWLALCCKESKAAVVQLSEGTQPSFRFADQDKLWTVYCPQPLDMEHLQVYLRTKGREIKQKRRN